MGIRNRGMVVGDTNRSRAMGEDTLHSRDIRPRDTVVGMVRLRVMVVVDTVPPQRSMVEWVRQGVRHWDWVEDCLVARFWRTLLRVVMMEAEMEVAMVVITVVMTVEGVMEEEETKAFASGFCFRDRMGNP